MSTLFEADTADEPGEDDPLLVEWAADLAVRIREGETVDWKELASHHPERAEALRRMLPAFALMAGMGKSLDGEAACRDTISESTTGPVCLGDFRTVGVLGRGGMGVVYEAVQISLNRRVALKILPTGSADDPRRVKRFQLEAQAAALLHDPHIVPVYLVGPENGVHFYVMQLIDGRTLADLITELRCARDGEPKVGGTAGPAGCSPHFAAELGRQAALALHHAHQQGILHRDVKPSNLLVEKTGWLWVADFGLARIAGEGDQTSTGMLMGTPRYMSPEQTTGTRGVIDHRTDVYSLGATLYELITLRPAFESDDRLELLTRIVRDDPISPRQIDPAIPRDLETIVLTAMSKNPGERYASAMALADDLGRFLDGRPITATPSTFLDLIAKKTRKHRSVMITAACFAVLLVASVVGVLTISNHSLRLAKDRADLNALEADRHRRTAEQRELEADRHLKAFQLRQAKEALDKGQVERAQDILRAIPGNRGWASEDTDSGNMGFAERYLKRLASREIVKFSDRQAERVNCLALSTDGRMLATGDNDGTIRLRDPATGEVAMTLHGHGHDIWNLAFSPDGRLLVSVGSYHALPRPNCEVLLWKTDSGGLMGRLEGFSDRAFERMEFDARGEHLWEVSSVEDGRWRLASWDVATDPAHPRLTWSRFRKDQKATSRG